MEENRGSVRGKEGGKREARGKGERGGTRGVSLRLLRCARWRPPGKEIAPAVLARACPRCRVLS